MSGARLGQFVRLATTLAAFSCMLSPLARAQPEGLPDQVAADAAVTPGTEAIAGSSEDTVAEESAPPEGPPANRPPSFPKMVLLDTGHVLTSPVRWGGRDWLVFSGATAGLAALSVADEPLSDAVREKGPSFGFVGEVVGELGGGGSIVLLGGFYLAGAIGKNTKAKNVCLDGLVASLIADGMVTPLVSTLVGRDRPTEERGAFSFHPFEGRSFPSGHATQAFAVASVIATSYDQLWVKATAYGAATLTAYGRLRRGKHFLTDVVAGAAIGTLVGRSVVRFNRKLRSGEREPERTAARLTVVPVVSTGTYGVSATLEF
ncbi:MAG: phosphatase PAP2 family protein [Thermoanaerobaculia bacterium]